MRIFPVPYAITEEEKIFGGYLSLRQVVYLALAAVAAMLLLFCARLLPLPLRLFLSFLLFLAGASLAFIRIASTGLDRYLLFAILYCRRQNRFYQKR